MAVVDNVLQVDSVCTLIPDYNLESLSETKEKLKAKATDALSKAKALAKKALETAKSKGALAKTLGKKASAFGTSGSGAIGGLPSRINNKNKSQGLFKDILCCKMPGLLDRLGGYQMGLGLGRRLDYNANFDLCANSILDNPMDALATVGNFIRKNPGILSGDPDTMLGALMRSDLMIKGSAFGLKRIFKDCLLRRFTNELGGLYGSDGSFGPSLRSRYYLRRYMASDPCLSAIADQPLVNKFLSDNSLGLLISTIVAMANGEDGKYAMLDSIFHMSGMQNNAIAGLTKSITYAVDYNKTNAKSKIKVINHYKKQNIIQDKHVAELYVPPSVIIESLDKDTIKKNA